MFEVPKALKPQVLAEFFELADKLIEDPKGTLWAYIPAVAFQSHLDFIHPKQDANGRTSEDWMVWWQRQLVRESEEQARREASTSGRNSFLLKDAAPVPKIRKDTMRSWYHHGLRQRYGNSENEGVFDPPPFLKEEFHEPYIQGRELIYSRIGEMQKFRRDMYRFLSERLGFKGEPKDFENFANKHADEVVEAFRGIYKDEQSLHRFTYNFSFDELEERLVATGEYSYQVLQPKDVIKPEYF